MEYILNIAEQDIKSVSVSQFEFSIGFSQETQMRKFPYIWCVVYVTMGPLESKSTESEEIVINSLFHTGIQQKYEI